MNLKRIKKPMQFFVFLTIYSLVSLTVQANNNPADQNASAAQQQSIAITGTVVDEAGETLIGASVAEQGTTNGAITDIDGNFSLNVSPNATLLITYIGYLPVTVKIEPGKSHYSIFMKEDSQSLEELVVIGYGVQKKKLVTGATVQVTADDIQKMSAVSTLGALQGQTPGVNITQSSGRPGAGYKVNIRGLGTNGNSSPLYVIDGISQGLSADAFNNLNPSDIESVDVLKDAASAAIYGAQAANGVILVTTKQGKAGKVQLTYDGYYGVQNVAKMVDPLNAQQYMMIQDEVRFNKGQSPENWERYLGPALWKQYQEGTFTGTNWLKEMLNEDAPIQNHAINLFGGSDVSRFTLGLTYSDQEGIIGNEKPLFNQRYTFRVNSDHVLLKGRGFDIIKIGENLSYTKRKKSGADEGNLYWNDVNNALKAVPLIPAYDYASEKSNVYQTKSGYPFYIANAMERDKTAFPNDWAPSNPLASQLYSSRAQNESNNFNLNANAYVEIQPIKNLKWRSVFNYNQNSWGYRSMDPFNENGYFRITPGSSTSGIEKITNQTGWGYGWGFENTLNYVFNLDLHNFDVLVGHNMGSWGYGFQLEASNGPTNFPNMWDYGFISNTGPLDPVNSTFAGKPDNRGRNESVFGRINYNYNETYLLTLIMRADGTSTFAPDNRWGYFPSISAGWVLTNESFMEGVRNVMNFFKIRGSWGQNGNNSVDSFQYLMQVSQSGDIGYYFGNNRVQSAQGAYVSRLPNVDLTWETSEQLDLGFDARFLNGRLNANFDYYVKTTRDWLVDAPALLSYGTGAPNINGGDVENKGFELVLSWNDRIGKDFRYGISVNGAYNKNKVLKLANSEGIIRGADNVLGQGTSYISRLEVGYPMGFFYGYKTDGVYQNQSEIQTKNNGVHLDSAQPGDMILVDYKSDGKINEDDKTMIGDPNPDFMAGLNINLAYKGFDFMISGTGAFGFQNVRSYRSFGDMPMQNYTTEIFERWHGEGTSNTKPRLGWEEQYFAYLSDLYVEDGDYFRIQNVTLGYDFKKLFPKMPLGQARLYVTAQNLYTFTSYRGMDPEIGYGHDARSGGGQNNWARGIDVGFYPSPRTCLVGVNIKF